MIIAALFELAVWIAVVAAVTASHDWLLLLLMAPVALFRMAVSLAALRAPRRG